MGGRPPLGAAAGLLTVAQLAVWAQAGALARVLLGRAFSGGSCAGGGWRCFATDGSARAGGALFHDVAANMLGSFLMALLSENSAHALWWEGFMPVSLLPREHWLQGYGNLWLGLRVGLCGSLTTFSSWNSQMVRLAAAGHGTPYAAGSQVVPALLGYLVGTIVALGCYVLGEQAAQAVGLRHLVARAVRKEGGGGEGGPGEAAGPAELGAVELRGAGGSAPPPPSYPLRRTGGTLRRRRRRRRAPPTPSERVCSAGEAGPVGPGAQEPARAAPRPVAGPGGVRGGLGAPRGAGEPG